MKSWREPRNKSPRGKRAVDMGLKALRDTPPWKRPEDTAKVVLDVLRNPEAPAADRLFAA